jgi:subtilisin family serine protease
MQKYTLRSSGNSYFPNVLLHKGHGSHVCGTIVGSNGQFQIGVAPNAQWIACRALDHTGSATTEDILTCFQWFLSPTTTGGLRPDPSKRPHIINNRFHS